MSKWTGQSTITCYITPSTHHCQISPSLPSRHLLPNPKVLGFLVYLVVLSAGQAALASIVGESGGTWCHLPVLLFRAPYLHHPIQIIFKNQPNCHTDFFPPTLWFNPNSRPQCVGGWHLLGSWEPKPTASFCRGRSCVLGLPLASLPLLPKWEMLKGRVLDMGIPSTSDIHRPGKNLGTLNYWLNEFLSSK